MKYLVVLINTLISVLTSIGDFVFSTVGLIYKVLKALLKSLLFLVAYSFRFTWKLAENILSYSKTLKRKTTDRIKLINFKFLLLTKNIKRKLRPNKKAKLNKKKKAKEAIVTFFPPPKHYPLKLKFFFVGFLFCAVFVLIPLLIYTFLMSLPNPKLLTERA